MANTWNARIAGQSVHFRGTSTVNISAPSAIAFPNARAISDAVYALHVSGGVSGTFGVIVQGFVGMRAGTAAAPNNDTVPAVVSLAGVTAIGAAGTYVLFPFNYGIDGLGVLGFTAGAGIVSNIDGVVPPSRVLFQSSAATAGISAHCVVNACVRLV